MKKKGFDFKLKDYVTDYLVNNNGENVFQGTTKRVLAAIGNWMPTLPSQIPRVG